MTLLPILMLNHADGDSIATDQVRLPVISTTWDVSPHQFVLGDNLALNLFMEDGIERRGK